MSTETSPREPVCCVPDAHLRPWLVLLACLMLVGCNASTADKAPPTATADQSEQAAEVVMQELPPALIDPGGQLAQDSSTGRKVTADLSAVDMTDALADEVAKLTALTKLTLRQSSMSLAGWQALAQLGELQQLDLRDCSVNNAQLTAAVAGMPKLRALRLSGQNGSTSVDDAGLAGLANCPQLKVLAADHLWISGEGLAHLADCPQLSELYLAGTLIDDQAMSQVAAMPKLRKLRLAKTSVSSSGLETLGSLPLEELDISECSQVLDEAMQPVGQIKTLKRLNLWRDSVSDTGVAHLSGLTQLEWLNLDNTHLSDAGLEHLRGLTNLTFLHLGSTAVSDAGMEQLGTLQALRDLKVTRTAVTEAGVATVTAAIPGVEVQLKYIEGE